MYATQMADFRVIDKNDEFDPMVFRRDFPLLNHRFSTSRDNGGFRSLIYLDNAATTQKPQQVVDAMVHFYSHQNANVHRGIYQLSELATAAYEQSRKTIAQFINASKTHEIIFTRGTTESVNLVATAYARKYLKAGDEIVLTEMEHHSNLIPWQLLAAAKEITLKFIPFNEDGTLDFAIMKKIVTERTKFIAITHLSNVFGTINPIRKFIKEAHKRNIPVLLDGAQSVPHLPTDVQNLDCDFLAFSGHKMCGPTGIGVLYAKEKWLELMDPYQGGGDMISAAWLDRATWNELPYKFEAGTPNIAGAIGLAAAANYLSAIGMERITRYEQELLTHALLLLYDLDGIQIYGKAPERGGVISFNLDSTHAHDLAQFFDSKSIAVRAGHHCAQPIMRKLNIPATTRASLYFYNTYDEIDLFVQTLKQAKEFFS